MKQEPKASKGERLGKKPRETSQGPGDGKAARQSDAVASSVVKPEFKKHIHTNAAAGVKPAVVAADAGAAVLSRRQLKNLAKRKKKEAAAAASAASGPGAGAAASSSASSAPSGDNTTSTAPKPKKAPLDPGKKAEVNGNWQALKKALVSGGPVITSRSSTPLHHVPGKAIAAAGAAAASAAPAAAAVPGVGLGGAAFASTSSIVALDCEMVAGAGPGGEKSALARVAIVDWNGDVLLDTFVKPQEKVLDHRTWVSGVRPEDLVDAPRFAAIQQKVADLIRGKIVVGHALRNDWSALLLSHPRALVRDTSSWGKKLHGREPSLKFMCENHLGGLEIQGMDSGHSPVEDSRASMLLYKKFRLKWEKDVMKHTPSAGKKKKGVAKPQ